MAKKKKVTHSNIAYVYADLIRKGKKTLDDVPASLRDQVEAILAGDDE